MPEYQIAYLGLIDGQPRPSAFNDDYYHDGTWLSVTRAWHDYRLALDEGLTYVVVQVSQ